MNKKIIAIATLASALTGCTVGPKYHRPAVAAPPAFRGDITQPSSASLADSKWFEVFKDEQLQNLIRTALEQNYDVREAAARVEAARASLGITRADQYPNVSVGANLTTERFARNGSFTVPVGFEQDRTFGTVSANLLSYEVDIWGRLRRATEAARADLLATEEGRKAKHEEND